MIQKKNRLLRAFDAVFEARTRRAAYEVAKYSENSGTQNRFVSLEPMSFPAAAWSTGQE